MFRMDSWLFKEPLSASIVRIFRIFCFNYRVYNMRELGCETLDFHDDCLLWELISHHSDSKQHIQYSVDEVLNRFSLLHSCSIKLSVKRMQLHSVCFWISLELSFKSSPSFFGSLCFWNFDKNLWIKCMLDKIEGLRIFFILLFSLLPSYSSQNPFSTRFHRSLDLNIVFIMSVHKLKFWPLKKGTFACEVPKDNPAVNIVNLFLWYHWYYKSMKNRMLKGFHKVVALKPNLY